MASPTRGAWWGPCLVLVIGTSCKPSGSPEPDAGEPPGRSPPTLDLLAGAIGGAGSADGAGGRARFDVPTGIAVDAVGNVYVADQRNHSIRRISRDGIVTTLAGTSGIPGSADGTGAAARFKFPTGVAVDRSGRVYVSDTGNHRIQVFSPAGISESAWGEFGSAAGQFVEPLGLVVDSRRVYVADSRNNRIQELTR